MAASVSPAVMESIQVGDIYCANWGYNRSVASFYEVTRKTAKRVELAPMKKVTVEEGKGYWYVMPEIGTANMKGKFLCKPYPVSEGEVGFSVSSFATAFKWNGLPMIENDD